MSAAVSRLSTTSRVGRLARAPCSRCACSLLGRGPAGRQGPGCARSDRAGRQRSARAGPAAQVSADEGVLLRRDPGHGLEAALADQIFDNLAGQRGLADAAHALQRHQPVGGGIGEEGGQAGQRRIDAEEAAEGRRRQAVQRGRRASSIATAWLASCSASRTIWARLAMAWRCLVRSRSRSSPGRGRWRRPSGPGRSGG